jgi:hypothetical protein
MARAIDADDLKRAVESFAGMLSPAGGFLVRQDAVLRAIELAPTIEAEHEWISVDDRLPEQYSVAIVFDGEWVGEAEYDGKRFHWSSDEDIAFATHWMPLPEPPEMNNEEEQE